jgi:hypothetical protein
MGANKKLKNDYDLEIRNMMSNSTDLTFRRKSTLSTSDSEVIEVALEAEVVDTFMVVGVIADI